MTKTLLDSKTLNSEFLKEKPPYFIYQQSKSFQHVTKTKNIHKLPLERHRESSNPPVTTDVKNHLVPRTASSSTTTTKTFEKFIAANSWGNEKIVKQRQEQE